MQASATVLNGPGATAHADKVKIMCEAFDVAVKNFCGKTQTETRQAKAKGKEEWEQYQKDHPKRLPVKDFNDNFFKALEKKDNALFKELNKFREEAGVVTGGRARLLSDIAKDTTATGAPTKLAKGAILAIGEIANLDASTMAGSRLPAVSKIAKCMGISGKGNTIFLDGKFKDGTVLELKGPGDAENGDGQFKKYKQASKGKGGIIIGCEACGSPCKEGNKCP